MALISCEQCNKEISEDAVSCPGCGHPRAPSDTGFGLGKILAIGLGVLIAGSWLLTPAKGKPSAAPEKLAATACREFARNSLIAPSKAEFPDEGASSLADPESPGIFLATGIVDSQNSFGATLRKRYRCKVQRTEDGKWRAVELKFE